MTCMSPLDGIPAFALESHKLIALGFPPDSVAICAMKVPNSCGMPKCASTDRISPAHCPVPLELPPPNSPDSPGILVSRCPMAPPRFPSAARALPGSLATATSPLVTRAPSADGMEPNTFLAMVSGFCLTIPPMNPSVTDSPSPSMTVLGLWMPKNDLTAFTMGSTTWALTQPPTDLRTPAIPFSRFEMADWPADRNPLAMLRSEVTIAPAAVETMPRMTPNPCETTPDTTPTTLVIMLRIAVNCDEMTDLMAFTMPVTKPLIQFQVAVVIART